MNHFSRQKTGMTIMGTLYFLITYKIVIGMVSVDPTCDYVLHSQTALTPWLCPYPLWHFGVYFIFHLGKILYNMPLEHACAIFTAFVNLFKYYVVYRLFEKSKVESTPLAAFGACIVSPILIQWFNTDLYSGQGSPNTWHNPTNMIVKPFAIISFYMIINLINKIKKTDKIEIKEYILLSIVLLLSALAKPSFFQGIVPALAIFIILYLVINKFNGFKEYAIICSCFIPAFLVIVRSYFVSFGTVDQGQGIAFDWFKVLGISSPNPYISLLIVIFFPLLYTLLNIKRVYTNPEYQLGWIYLLTSWLQAAALYEKGPRMDHGNLTWAMQVAFFVIWVITIKDMVLDLSDLNTENRFDYIKKTFLLFIMMIHIFTGALWAWSFLGI